jgi:hypothetical protein
MRIPKEKARQKDHVLLVWKDKTTGEVIKTARADNIVTNAGNKFYAQRGASEVASLTFETITVAAAGIAVSAGATYGQNTTNVPTGGAATVDSGYPKTSDDDADNTGADSNVVTWRASYTTAEANTNIKAVMVHQAQASTKVATASSNFLLNVVTLAVSEPKTSNSTLTAFVNHTFLGV